jgi:hypothetical protein
MSKFPEKLRSWSASLLIVAFFLLLWLPTLDSFLKLDKAPQPNEKREPAPGVDSTRSPES